jgi:hypothetical protein
MEPHFFDKPPGQDESEQVFFGLSLRQFAFSVLGCGASAGMYFLLRGSLGIETLSWLCILAAVPFGMMGFVRYNGMNAEQALVAIVKSVVLTPRVLVFKSENTYEAILELMEKERRRERMRHPLARRKRKEA